MIQRFQDFVTGITVCYKHIQRIKSMEMTELGLKGNQVMAIFFLHQHPEGLTATQLCQLCAEDKAAVSRTLATLQELGYIDSYGKKYRAQLHLTPKGLELAEYVDEHVEQWVGFGGDGLTEEERTIFYRALGKIAGNLRDNYAKRE